MPDEMSDSQVLDAIVKELTPTEPLKESAAIVPQNPPSIPAVDLSPLNARIDAIVERIEKSSGKQLGSDDIREAVMGAIQGLTPKDKPDYDPDQPLTMGQLKNFQGDFEKRLQDAVGSLKQETEIIKQRADLAERLLYRRELDTAMDKAEIQFPHMDRTSVLGSFIAMRDAGMQVDLNALAKESHERLSPENFDLKKLSKTQRAQVVKEMMDEKKAELSKTISPQAGGPIPSFDDALMKELTASSSPLSWEALEALANGEQIPPNVMEKIRADDAFQKQQREARKKK